MPTIQLEMTWESTLPMLLMLVTDGDAKGQAYARQELKRMAWLADNAASPLDLSLYPMTTTEEGARIAEYWEEVDHYDVLLRFEGGEAIEEHENLTEAEADAKFDELQEKYSHAYGEDLRHLLLYRKAEA